MNFIAVRIWVLLIPFAGIIVILLTEGTTRNGVPGCFLLIWVGKFGLWLVDGIEADMIKRLKALKILRQSKFVRAILYYRNPSRIWIYASPNAYKDDISILEWQDTLCRFNNTLVDVDGFSWFAVGKFNIGHDYRESDFETRRLKAKVEMVPNLRSIDEEWA